MMQPLYGGAAARPFVTHHNALDMPLYLRIADELYLKRLLVGGFERVYEIGHNFRNEGMDRTHNPEFTMLEFYQAYADYGDMMALVEELVRGVVRALPRHAPASSAMATDARLHAAVRADADSSRRSASGRASTVADRRRGRAAAAAPCARRRGRGAGGARRRPAAWTSCSRRCVEPDLVQPTFVIDHPEAALAAGQGAPDDPGLTERFELFVGGRELANAFSELNDPDDQRRRFEDQARQRAAGDEEAQPYDADYIRALEYGMPPAGGVGHRHRPADHAARPTSRRSATSSCFPRCGRRRRWPTGPAPSAPTSGSIFRRPTSLEWRHRPALPPEPPELAASRSLNTVISTGGVAVGVMALIVVLGVMNGLRTTFGSGSWWPTPTSGS